MRDERSSMAASMALAVGEGVLSGRIASASRARSVGRMAGEMFGRRSGGGGGVMVVGVLDMDDSDALGVEGGDGSVSKRADRTAESCAESGEVVVVVEAIGVGWNWPSFGEALKLGSRVSWRRAFVFPLFGFPEDILVVGVE
jgi:hypothetical protein